MNSLFFVIQTLVLTSPLLGHIKTLQYNQLHSSPVCGQALEGGTTLRIWQLPGSAGLLLIGGDINRYIPLQTAVQPPDMAVSAITRFGGIDGRKEDARRKETT